MKRTLPKHSVPRRHRGFTLIELLVVLGIIVLLLAAAVPAFNYITGSRSTDSAENQISAMLARGRNYAIKNGSNQDDPNYVAGVAFFVNPRDNRATMALVASVATPPYIGWTKSSYPGITPTYLYDQRATAVVNDKTVGANNRLIVGTFSEVNTSGTTSYPPDSPASGNWTNGTWNGGSNVQYLDFPADSPSDFEGLPAGVAVQLINDPKGLSVPTNSKDLDRYVQTGAILFDKQGRLVSTPISFNSSSQFYKLLARNTTSGPSQIPSGATLYSQLGVVLYDRAAFLNQPNFTEGDTVWQTDLLLNGPTLNGQESAEEKWLDDNTTPRFVNRSNGILIKGQ